MRRLFSLPLALFFPEDGATLYCPNNPPCGTNVRGIASAKVLLK